MTDCVFCRIAAGSIPSHRVFEDDELVAFLDIQPIRAGHVLIVTRRHYVDFTELPDPLAESMVRLGRRFGALQKRLWGVERAGFFFTGGDVSHVHAHVVPLVEKTDVTSRRYIAEPELTFRPPPREPDARLAEVAQRLAAELGEA
ncbi:histidine triad (HIT) family protein [Tistlia consotensis]|uniref:Histidine triad (HIT) family protein n=1 Tax=Tistlia consotensis USBA 355 TaxID=560819 RepID=A0A1Y6CTF6_9PROT|nr:HIT family protein [Tistlia consotensis]SMF75662.1 histidine triad (HIT) family protein [Tistlia consotensis USBA 355]SNS07610.1 histidine triad (HIT) family protein [Tistlia consotensis]